MGRFASRSSTVESGQYRAQDHPVETATRQGAHFPHIDGLRAVAVVAVIIFHLNHRFLPGGFVGVDVFFVISGFVVTHALSRSTRHRPLRALSDFSTRRLIRIVPPLGLMLAVTCVTTALFVPSVWLSDLIEHTALYAFFGLSNLKLGAAADTYFAPASDFNPFTHTWSLGVEEQFYLVLPLLMLVVFRLARFASTSTPRRWPMLLLAGPMMGSLAYQRYLQHAYPLTAFYSIGSRFWEMASGALLALVFLFSERLETPRSQIVCRGARIVGAAVLAFAVAFGTEDGFPYPGALLPVVATILLIIGSSWHPRNDRSILTHPVSVWLGQRSYSLYLWHWPVFVLFRWTIGFASPLNQVGALLLSFALAETSFQTAERLSRTHRSRRSTKNWKVALPIITLTILLASISTNLRTTADQFGLSTVSRHPEHWIASEQMMGMENQRHCNVEVDRPRWAIVLRPDSCTPDANLQDRQVFVIGDSHANSYRMALDQLAAETGVTVYITSYSGCSYVGLVRTMASEPCVKQHEAFRSNILKQSKPGDLVFLASLRVPRLTSPWEHQNEQATIAHMNNLRDTTAQQSTLREADPWLRPFTDAGVTVLFDRPMPVFRAPAMRCSDWFNRSNEICQPGLSIDRSFVETYRQPINSMIDQLESQNPLIESWDPLPALCPTTTCHSVQAGHPIITDGDHLGPLGNQIIYPDLRAAIIKQLTP